MEVNETYLKAWLVVLSNWVDICKSDAEKVFSFDKNGNSLCTEFLKHFGELQTYLNQLAQWLLNKVGLPKNTKGHIRRCAFLAF